MEIKNFLHKNILITGQTGSGKSNFVSKLIAVFLDENSPEDFRLVLIDPKRVQFSIYNSLPHLLFEVIYELKQTRDILKWIWIESLRRLNEIEKSQNSTIDKFPEILIVIDEAADLMTFDKQFFEDYINKITALSNVTGIYLIFSTARPSSDSIITEKIRRCFLDRIAFKVSKEDDSILIIVEGGAENLINPGSCLVKNLINQKAKSFQMPYISEEEEKEIIKNIKEKYKN